MIVSTRLRISAALGLAAVFGLGVLAPAFAQAPKKAGAHFSFTGKRPTFHEDNIENIEVVVSGRDSEGNMSLIESYWTPAFSVSPHYHTMHAETFYIISGQVEWTIGGETHVMKAGDLVHIPANTVHAVKVIGPEKMHSLMFYQSGGYEEAVSLEAALTPEQRKDPKVRALLTGLTDFHPVPAMVAVSPAAPGQPKKGVPVFTFRGKRPGFTEGSVEGIETALSSAQSEGRLSIIESNWLPGFNAPLHYHTTHHEAFYVLSGQVEWTAGGETHVLKKGDAVYIPPDVLHSVKVVGPEKLHTLWIGAPGGLDENPGRASGLTEEEQKDPKVQKILRTTGDFHTMGPGR